jgi:hypothetical protein
MRTCPPKTVELPQETNTVEAAQELETWGNNLNVLKTYNLQKD